MPAELHTPIPQERRARRPDAARDALSDSLAPDREALSPVLVGSPSGWAMRLCYFAGDACAILTGVVVGKLAASIVSGSWWSPFAEHEVKLFALLALGVYCVAAWSGTYNPVPPRPVRQFRSWTTGTLAIAGAVITLAWLFGLGGFETVVGLPVAAVAALFAASLNRALCRIWFGSRAWWGTRVLVVGTNPAARHSIHFLHNEPQWGLRPVGYLAEDESLVDSELPLPCLGEVHDLERASRRTGVRRALVALHPVDLKEMRKQYSRSDAAIHQWIIVPNSNDFSSLWAECSETARMPTVTVKNRLAKPRDRFLKRAMDLTVAGLLTLALSPLLLLISVLIRLTSEGPIVYRHRRLGLGGRTFKAWKFRTMVADGDDALHHYFEQNPGMREEWDSQQKLRRDPRVTAVGRFLRVTSLDELPQLWNVLRGEMSLVGPRPIVAAEAEKYREFFAYYRQVPPGVTGLWQVSGRNNTSYGERVELDTYYVENWSLWLDLYILACTVKVVLLREGAY